MVIHTNFKSCEIEATVRFKECLTRPLIRGAGSHCKEALTDFFDSTYNKYYRKKEVFGALNRLADWIEREEKLTCNLINLPIKDIERFLSTISSNRTRQHYRAGLRFVHNLFLERGIISINPIANAPSGPKINTDLPAIYTRLGEGAAAVVDVLYPQWDSRRTDNRTKIIYALRRFCEWAEEKHIYDLKDVSIGDALEYRASFSSVQAGRQQAYYLRQIFQNLENKGIITRNPFPALIPAINDRTIGAVLNMARRSGKNFEDALRKFLDERKRNQGMAYSLHAVALNHLVDWFSEGERITVTSFTQVNAEQLYRYHAIGPAHFPAKTSRSYLSAVIQFFDYLHQYQLLSTNPAAGTLLRGYIYSPQQMDMSPKVYSILRQAKGHSTVRRRQLEPVREFPGDFSMSDVLSSTFERRLALARVIRFVDLYKRTVSLRLSDKGPCSTYLTRKSQLRQPENSYWVIAESAGIIRQVDGKKKFTRSFISCYHALNGELRTWASDFVERYERNMRLYATEQEEGRETPRRASFRKSAVLVKKAA